MGYDMGATGNEPRGARIIPVRIRRADGVEGEAAMIDIPIVAWQIERLRILAWIGAERGSD